MRLKLVALIALLGGGLSGCATYGVIDNHSQTENVTPQNYSLANYAAEHSRSDDITIVLAFSGGGSRAAALSYGVLEGLRDTKINIGDREVRLLDEVDLITSVSGGSFTAAYYGLHGDKIFTNFEDDFLRRDYVSEWLYGIASPLLWFSNKGRTDIATRIYEERLFKGATFADLNQRNGPLVLINASDLGGGVRFSFVQEYFDLLCSNIASYPIARAVTASSAVPVMLNPVVLQNHKGCYNPAQNYLEKLDEKKIKEAQLAPQLIDTLNALRSYQNRDERKFIHLVDGGITDNLGLMAFYELVEIGGGIANFMERIGSRPSKRLVIISVNASTKPRYNIEHTNKIADIEPIISAVTDTQLHRYNSATISLIRRSMERWSEELSTYWEPIDPFFIEISFDGIQQEQRRVFFNQIPTSLSLSEEQADELTRAGVELLQHNAEFQRLLYEIEGKD
ncbi:patatin-like phospholipase family protein [Pseudidiomarina gelatinasegens]|uniref:patatin-like phospholipase family protein n=1 Tax=Pseudidiomarina gelatinasegens TaxID=2487740 RepID=UPI0030EEBE0D|tara:strand:- start:721 stop:2076 length:1356 start_codon:yes stop_codon:yes gene_type:complete